MAVASGTFQQPLSVGPHANARTKYKSTNTAEKTTIHILTFCKTHTAHRHRCNQDAHTPRVFVRPYARMRVRARVCV